MIQESSAINAKTPAEKLASQSSLRNVAWSGAGTCTWLAFAYAGAFVLYAFIRSALTVQATVNQDAGIITTLIATWSSILVAALTITILLAIPVAIVGAITGLIIKQLDMILNSRHSPRRAVLIGLITGLGIVAVLHLALRSAVNFSLSDLGSEAALFWIELPCLIFVVASALVSWRAAKKSIPSH